MSAAADRDGRHAFYKLSGTPWVVAFSIDGETLAVATGAPRGYLFSRDLRLKWSGPMSRFPVTWPDEIMRPARPDAREFRREDVERLFGVPPWGQGEGDSISDDGQWRVMWTAPYRGEPGFGIIQLRGPAANGFSGRFGTSGTPRWTKKIGIRGTRR